MKLLRWILAIPLVYRAHNAFVNAPHAYRVLVAKYICPQPGCRIVDIGCGTADILEYLPENVDYFGLDISAPYIEHCRQRYGKRGRFMQAAAGEMKGVPTGVDIVLAVGVLHHLNDEEALALLRQAEAILKDGGRLVTFDGCYVEKQSPIAKWLLDHDRGEFVRTQAAYQTLAKQVFPHVDGNIRHDLLRIPYTHHIMRCIKQSLPSFLK